MKWFRRKKESNEIVLNDFWEALMPPKKVLKKVKCLGKYSTDDEFKFWSKPPADLLTIIRFMKSNESPIPLLNKPNGLKAHFSKITDCNNIDKFLRPAILFTDQSILSLPFNISVWSDAQLLSPRIMTPMHFHVFDKQTHLERYVNLLRSLEPLVRKGFIFPLPESMKIDIGASIPLAPPGERHPYPSESGEYEKMEDHLETEFTFLDDEEYVGFEAAKALSSNMSDQSILLNFSLPLVQGIPLSDLINLRNDESDKFSDFHRVLSKHLSNYLLSDDEQKIKYAAQEIEYESKKLENNINELKILKKIASVRITSFYLGLILSVYPSLEMFRSLGSILGVGSILGLLSDYKESEKLNNIINNSAYHIPLKLNKFKKEKSADNRVAGGFSPPAPTPPGMRVRTGRFTEITGP